MSISSARPQAGPPSRKLSLLLVGLALSIGLGCQMTKDGPTRADKIALQLDLANRYFHLGEMERAQEQAEKGLAIDPNDVSLRLTLGRILQHRAKRETIQHAESVFRRLMREEDEDWRIPLALGEVLERKGLLYSEAARDIRSGVRYTDSNDPDERAEELEKVTQESWEEAIEHFEASLEIRNDEGPVNGLQRVYSLLGQRENSLEWSERMLELISVRKRAWREELSRSQISAEDERRFNARLKEDDAKEARTRLLASSTLKALGRLPEAIDHLSVVVELAPEMVQAFSRRAVLHYELGQYQRAVDSIDRYLRSVVDRSFDDPDVRKAYDLRDNALSALNRAENS